jgi:glycosyltransferase involved in cell wall biosynthesis
LEHTAAVRALFVAFYFPPAGGGGVQRTLKFCRYLPDFGVDVHVLAPDDPKWFARDEPSIGAIPPSTTVHRARFLGPRAASRADALRGSHGLGRLAVEARFAYQRALLPDKAAPWAITAVPAGIRAARSNSIDVVVSTSPPTSTHLIAEAIAAGARLPFVADFRDSWLEHPHRSYEKASVRAKRRVLARMAGSVGRRASGLVAATGAIADELARVHPSARHKTTVIENGADFDDFAALEHRPGERFTIVHAGAFFGQRSPRPFLTALRDLVARRPDLDGRVLARFVGELRAEDRDWAASLGIDGCWEETGFLPYTASVAAQRAADALLLLIPQADGRGDTVLSGKVFEYIASARPILASVPVSGVAANLVRSVGAGEVVAPDDPAAIAEALERLIDARCDGGLPDIAYPDNVRDRLSRRARARDLAAVLQGVAG